RFGVVGEGAGICYTRTGRRFFDDPALEAELLAAVRSTLDAAGFRERFQTTWCCLDCELMPWSAKAQELLKQQYAAVGAAARGALAEALPAWGGGGGRTEDAAALLTRYQAGGESAEQSPAASRRYCWPVASVSDLRLAPFHLLATEGAVHVGRDHTWHMETLAE